MTSGYHDDVHTGCENAITLTKNYDDKYVGSDAKDCMPMMRLNSWLYLSSILLLSCALDDSFGSMLPHHSLNNPNFYTFNMLHVLFILLRGDFCNKIDGDGNEQ